MHFCLLFSLLFLALGFLPCASPQSLHWVWKGSAQSGQGLETRPMLSLQVCSTLPTQPGSPCPAMMQMRLFLLGTCHSREHSLLGARAASAPDLIALSDAVILTLQAFTASLLSLSLFSAWKRFVGIFGVWSCQRNLLQVTFQTGRFKNATLNAPTTHPPKKGKNQWVHLFADNAIYEARNFLGFSSLDRGGHKGVLILSPGTAGLLSLIHGPKLSKLYEPPQKI